MIIGKTGAGKSTLINFLLGIKLKKATVVLKKFDKNANKFIELKIDNAIVANEENQNNNNNNLPKIGHENISETSFITAYNC